MIGPWKSFEELYRISICGWYVFVSVIYCRKLTKIDLWNDIRHRWTSERWNGPLKFHHSGWSRQKFVFDSLQHYMWSLFSWIQHFTWEYRSCRRHRTIRQPITCNVCPWCMMCFARPGFIASESFKALFFLPFLACMTWY